MILWWFFRFIEGLNNGARAFGGQTTRDGVRIVSRDVTTIETTRDRNRRGS